MEKLKLEIPNVSPKYKILDEIWIMRKDKPTCYWVWEILKREYLSHKSDYGQPYNHQIYISYDYILVSSNYNDYQASKLNLSVLQKEKVPYFSTKQDLIDSL